MENKSPPSMQLIYLYILLFLGPLYGFASDDLESTDDQSKSTPIPLGEMEIRKGPTVGAGASSRSRFFNGGFAYTAAKDRGAKGSFTNIEVGLERSVLEHEQLKGYGTAASDIFAKARQEWRMGREAFVSGHIGGEFNKELSSTKNHYYNSGSQPADFARGYVGVDVGTRILLGDSVLEVSAFGDGVAETHSCVPGDSGSNSNGYARGGLHFRYLNQGNTIDENNLINWKNFLCDVMSGVSSNDGKLVGEFTVGFRDQGSSIVLRAIANDPLRYGEFGVEVSYTRNLGIKRDDTEERHRIIEKNRKLDEERGTFASPAI